MWFRTKASSARCSGPTNPGARRGACARLSAIHTVFSESVDEVFGRWGSSWRVFDPKRSPFGAGARGPARARVSRAQEALPGLLLPPDVRRGNPSRAAAARRAPLPPTPPLLAASADDDDESDDKKDNEALRGPTSDDPLAIRPKAADLRDPGDLPPEVINEAVASRRNARSEKGSAFEDAKRRRGRPAWRRKQDDTPLRDGNRDRLMGLLTERAARTLLFYLTETNPTGHAWLRAYLHQYPIPRDEGTWADISGETFLRRMLNHSMSEANFGDLNGMDSMYSAQFGTIAVSPRDLAQRIMDVRTKLASEFVDDLIDVKEENAVLLRETLAASLGLSGLGSLEEEGGEGGEKGRSQVEGGGGKDTKSDDG